MKQTRIILPRPLHNAKEAVALVVDSVRRGVSVAIYEVFSANIWQHLIGIYVIVRHICSFGKLFVLCIVRISCIA